MVRRLKNINRKIALGYEEKNPFFRASIKVCDTQIFDIRKHFNHLFLFYNHWNKHTHRVVDIRNPHQAAMVERRVLVFLGQVLGV